MARFLWNIQSSFYHLFRHNPLSVRILQQENEAVRQLLTSISDQPLKRGLDIGSGRGNSLELIPAGTARWVAIDYSRGMVGGGRNKFPGVRFVVGDTLQLPFKDENFDLILCVGVSEYLRNLENLLKQMWQLLKPGGFGVLTISPPTVLNFFRWMIGHRIFPAREADLEKNLIHIPLTIKAKNHTVLQVQYLLMKEGRRFV